MIKAVFLESLPSAAARAAFAVCVAGVALWASAATAQQSQDQADLEAAYEAAFQETLRDPANLDKLFSFAELAVAVGDVEGAITALERMLVYNPDLPRVRLELGVLYFRLGSYQIAKSYLTRAIEGEDVPETVRERVNVYLAEIDNRLGRHQFAGSFFGGYRYQSNANTGPSSPAVTVFGLPATLGDQFTQQSDDNIFISGSLRHAYDLQTQSGEAWQSNLLFYGSRQDEQNQLDLGVLEADTGFAGVFEIDFIGPVGYRPYLVGSVVTLEDKRYLTTWGGGLTLTKSFARWIGADLTFEHRERTFKDNGTRPTAEQQTGDEDSVRLVIGAQVTPTFLIRVAGSVDWETAANPIFGNREEAASITLTKDYPAPGILPGRWVSSASATILHQGYNEIDPTIDPFNRRIDRERRFQFVQTIPIWDAFSLVTTAQRVIVDSSLPNFSYDNTVVTIGVSFRF
jgi:tetratricopeptide (TPR) repeat protein